MSTVSIRVLSVPAGHVYVHHLDDASIDEVVRLPDPALPRRATGAPWWPPVALEARWVLEHAHEFDVFHVHFGFDARSPQQLTELVDALRRTGTPLVYTVHDLRNPHHPDRSTHDAQLDVLIPAADALITLTAGAAREIHDRWGRRRRADPLPAAARPRRVRRRRASQEPACQP
jgi:beta-1,4-mannosyltransferase